MSETVLVAIIAGLAGFVGALVMFVGHWIISENMIHASGESQAKTEDGLQSRLEQKMEFGFESLKQAENGLQNRLQQKIEHGFEKMYAKLDRQYELKWRTDWQLMLHDSLSEFIVATDPDLIEGTFNRRNIVSLIHKTTILLNNREIESHGRLNAAILKYAMYITGYEGGGFNRAEAMHFHEELVEASKIVLYSPPNNS